MQDSLRSMVLRVRENLGIEVDDALEIAEQIEI
jgi:hypothetical protein